MSNVCSIYTCSQIILFINFPNKILFIHYSNIFFWETKLFHTNNCLFSRYALFFNLTYLESEVIFKLLLFLKFGLNHHWYYFKLIFTNDIKNKYKYNKLFAVNLKLNVFSTISFLTLYYPPVYISYFYISIFFGNYE